ncbi:MAG TPA: hypothetical protein PLY91_06655 [Methanoregulaceae archaeon]|nr:hypothetical protein [Methanoregulaceae archaeon]
MNEVEPDLLVPNQPFDNRDPAIKVEFDGIDQWKVKAPGDEESPGKADLDVPVPVIVTETIACDTPATPRDRGNYQHTVEYPANGLELVFNKETSGISVLLVRKVRSDHEERAIGKQVFRIGIHGDRKNKRG